MSLDSRNIRILSDLDGVFKQDPLIEEYDILPVLSPLSNKSPLLLENHKLGVELWCIKDLFLYAYSNLMKWKRMNSTYIEPGVILSLSRATLLINPEITTVWNIRKEEVIRGELAIDTDLQFATLILTKHPKSHETFSHRRWLISRVIRGDKNISTNEKENHTSSTNQTSPKNTNKPTNINSLLPSELSVCEKAASRYPCNYAAWSHRAWVVTHLINYQSQVLDQELANTLPWVQSHISDHSGFYYRQFLLSSLNNTTTACDLQSHDLLIHDDVLKNDNPSSINHCSHTVINNTGQFKNNDYEYESNKDSIQRDIHVSSKEVISGLDTELDLTTDLLCRYPEHQAIWYHRRFCFQRLYESLRLSSLPTTDVINKSKRTKLDRRLALVTQEEIFVNKLLTETLPSYVVRLINAHEKWVNKIVDKD